MVLGDHRETSNHLCQLRKIRQEPWGTLSTSHCANCVTIALRVGGWSLMLKFRKETTRMLPSYYRIEWTSNIMRSGNNRGVISWEPVWIWDHKVLGEIQVRRIGCRGSWYQICGGDAYKRALVESAICKLTRDKITSSITPCTLHAPFTITHFEELLLGRAQTTQSRRYFDHGFFFFSSNVIQSAYKIMHMSSSFHSSHS